MKMFSVSKFWNKLPIARKLMTVTIIVFLVFSFIIFIGQIAFFDNYYTYIRHDEIKDAVLSFEKNYEDSLSEAEVRTLISRISEDGECYMMIIDEGGAVKYALSYDMTVLTTKGETIRVALDDVVNKKDFSKLELAVGREVKVQIFGENTPFPMRTFFPLSIETDNASWQMIPPEQRERVPSRRPVINNVSEITGTITAIVLPTEQARNINSERLAASRAAMEWMNNGRKISGKPYEYVSPENSERFSVMVKAVTDENKDVIFAIAPLNMVTEAVKVSRHMYFSCFVFAMLAACIMAIIFAKIATNPIVRITEVTKKMAQLDFSDRCENSSHDEIGELAQNINILSSSLDSAINDLQSANSKLQIDIERERAIEKSRRDFVAAASHELKTPLGIIRAYTEAIIDDISQSKRQHYAEVIAKETEHMDRLILDMLDNAKFEVGAEKPALGNYDIARLIKNVLERFEAVIKQKQINLICNGIEKEAIAKFDVDMMERVITNFITNAVAHTPEKGCIIASVQQDSDKIYVSVENSGSKIPCDELDSIWDKFYKADKSRNRSLGGTGLGLSIAKNILNLHNASYYAENTSNGVKFTFILK